MTIQDIYQILDDAAPFSLQESYDKSGLLAGDPSQPVQKVMLTLDITVPVIEEAAAAGADLLIAHHPVIWEPLKAVTPAHPVYHLVRAGVGAICSHTCMDIAADGLNDYIGGMMAEQLGFTGEIRPFVQLDANRVLGRMATLSQSLSVGELAQRLKATFSVQGLRYYTPDDRKIRTIAWCSGSGGDLIDEAIAMGADALITGDCKHSIWAEAQNRAFPLYDCGHFETEVPFTALVQQILRDKAPELEVVISQKGTQPMYQVI